MSNHTINWHSALISGLKIELSDYHAALSYQTEFSLNTGPRRIDCLIQRSDTTPIDTPLAAIFRQYNIIDYKGPSESSNITNFYKVLSYAYSLPDFFNDNSVLDQITLTFITHKFPYQLIRHLKKLISKQITSKRENCPEKLLEKVCPGLYHMNIYNLPMQLIILPQLSPKQYLWLHCLTNHITSDFPIRELGKAYASHKNDPEYQNFMNTFIRANLMKKGCRSIMCEALYELFADELIAREQNGIGQGMNQFAALVRTLISEKRDADVQKAACDPAYRDALLQHYKLQ